MLSSVMDGKFCQLLKSRITPIPLENYSSHQELNHEKRIIFKINVIKSLFKIILLCLKRRVTIRCHHCCWLSQEEGHLLRNALHVILFVFRPPSDKWYLGQRFKQNSRYQICVVHLKQNICLNQLNLPFIRMWEFEFWSPCSFQGCPAHQWIIYK